MWWFMIGTLAVFALVFAVGGAWGGRRAPSINGGSSRAARRKRMRD